MPPPQPSTPPTVLILGGTTTLARSLALYLLSPSSLAPASSTPAQARACFVRLADRFSVNPPSTYLDKPFRELLAASSDEGGGLLEYKQVNLGNKERHAEVFVPPEEWGGVKRDWKDRGFEVVYDLTGEVGFDKPELIQISNTYNLSLSLLRSAAALPPATRPKAYIRLTFPFYEMKSLPASSAGHGESAELRPDGVRGRWWHETLRGLGVVAEQEGINVGVVRTAAWYGPGSWEGSVMPRVVAGHVYQYLKEEMKFLYNADLRINTVHTTDVSQALYLLSLLLLSSTRSSLRSQPSSSSSGSIMTKIPYTFTPPPSTGFSLSKSSSDKRTSLGETYKTISTVVPAATDVWLPVFNIVDEGDSTQEKLGKAVADVWGIKHGFLNSTMASLVQSFAKTDFSEMCEDVNEMHVEAWSKMLAESRPPIASTPITPFLDEHAFRKLAICLDGAKARTVLGFKAAHPRVEVAELKAIVKGFQDDGICRHQHVVEMPKLS